MSIASKITRTQIKDPVKLAQLVAKVSALVVKKKNAFNIDYKGLYMVGEKMSSVDFSTPGQVSFTYAAVNYVLAFSDLYSVKRLRCRKYQFRTSVLTIVP